MRDQVARAVREAGPRFFLFFLLWLGAFALLFEMRRTLFVHGFMYPVAACTAGALRLLGVDAMLGELQVSAGMCFLAVESVVYRVTFECTGIFALFMCLAAVMAFPAAKGARARGVALVVPAFFCYSVTRMVVLGIVASVAPAHIELFHLYVMVLVNVGFVVALWLYWLDGVVVEVRE